MTATTAKKKRAIELDELPQDNRERVNGLWINESLLPTNLAKKGSPKDMPVTDWRSASAESKVRNRTLRLADIVLGNLRSTFAIERRNSKKKFKGVERRSTR